MARGFLIAFSGIDGAGKSTQIELLTAAARARGIEPVYIWTRGGYTPSLDRLRALLRRLPGRVVPAAGDAGGRARALGSRRTRRVWLAAAMLDLLWIYGVRVRLLRAGGRFVLCDRYLPDSLVDFESNFPDEKAGRWALWRLLARAAPVPDVSILLVVPPEESRRRSRQKGEPLHDSAEILEERYRRYVSLGEARGCRMLDGRRPVEELAAEIAGAAFANPAGAGAAEPIAAGG